MENKVYRKRIDWISIGGMLPIIVIMSFLLLFPSDSFWGTTIAVFFVALFLLIICLSVFGVLFYRLTVTEDCIIDKKIFKKKEVYYWKDIRKIVVSIDDNTINLYGDQLCLTLRIMKNSDQLINELCEKLGWNNLEIGRK